jgi:hypothetical protein
MESQDRALKGTENTGLLWMLVYLLIGVIFLDRAFNAWDAFHTQTFSWRILIDFGCQFLALPIPLTMGLAFRKTLKGELAKNLLSERTYRICHSWIAQLLLLAYICLAIIHR